MTAARGQFLVLEGADGSGKSTQAHGLVERLRAAGTAVLHVRDPGGTLLAEEIRRILLDPASGEVAVRAEAFLYLAARAQLAAEVVEPALAVGTTVVCERWTLSTEVYQGLAGGMDPAEIRRLGEVAAGPARPDMVLLLDVEEGEGLRRVGPEKDRIEGRGAAFHDAVVRGYRELAAGRPDHVIVPPGSPEEVGVAVIGAVARVVAGAVAGALERAGGSEPA